jgi:4a-hydroxytetrahydrobiopterin dehydratase
MVTRAERVADFTTDADPASQTLVEVLCEDHVGTYLLPFLCRLTPEGFRNARTGELIEGRVVGWRERTPVMASRSSWVRFIQPMEDRAMSTKPAQLVSKSCTPCRGGIPPLTPDEAKAHLRQTPDWALLDDAHRIERTFTFKNFAEAFAFVQRAADLAEAEGHHPDITFGWGYATVSLQTHKIKGLHENDFIMAAKLDRLTTG